MFISAFCLILGLAIYTFLRHGTYYHEFLPQGIRAYFSNISNSVPDNFITDFIRFWFVDFLWGVSLTFALISVLTEATKKKLISAACVSFAAGVVYELCQLFSLVSGTFDILDVAMYAAASFVCAAVSINLFLRRTI